MPATQIRRAEAGDEQWLLRWRNHPSVAGTATNGKLIAAEEHHRWFQGVLGSDEHFLYIAETDGEASGMVRFDVRNDEVEVSIFVIPKWKNLGVGSAALELSLQDVFGRKPIRSVLARVRTDNPVSLAFFARHGFTAQPASTEGTIVSLRRVRG